MRAKIQLEQDLESRRRRFDGLDEPLPQLGKPVLRDRVDVSIGLSGSCFSPARHESLAVKPPQHRVDVPDALVPEVRERVLDFLSDVVTGSRSASEQAENCEFGSISHSRPLQWM